jgi:hypothetical protein
VRAADPQRPRVTPSSSHFPCATQP